MANDKEVVQGTEEVCKQCGMRVEDCLCCPECGHICAIDQGEPYCPVCGPVGGKAEE